MAEALEDTSGKLNTFLKERKQSPEDVPGVKRSLEMAAKHQKQRSLIHDPDTLTRKQKEETINDFLKKKSPTGRSQRRVTKSQVNQEYARILEQFLQNQLERQDVQTKPRPGRYQRYVEVDVKEKTSPGESEDSPVNLPSVFIRGDSIPFADESDEEHVRGKNNSVPLDALFSGQEGIEIHHEKSRSAPHPVIGQYSDGFYSRKKPNSENPPPPPPPCTPHSESENSREPSPVPYLIGSGKADGSGTNSIQSSSRGSLDVPTDRRSSSRKRTPPPPNTLDINYGRNEKERSKTPMSESDWTAQSRSRSSSSPSKGVYSLNRSENRMSGSLSSNESDASIHSFKDRKKKSFFKKTRERVGHFLRINKDKSESPQEDSLCSGQDFVKPKRKKRKTKKTVITTRGKKAKAEDLDESDMVGDADVGSRGVLEERHIHTNKHIHQHHTDKDMMLRVEETDQIIDVDQRKQKKHIEKHWKVKESSDTHDTGILSRLRRMTSKDKSKKTALKGLFSFS